jgi:type VI protein secretion system component Hcp
MKSFHIALCSLVLSSAAVSHTAQPAGAMVCAGSAGTLTLPVSFFDVGVSSGTGSASSGAGAGKVTFQPFVVHVPLSHFTSLYQAVVAGTHFSTCTLTTQDSSGANIEFVLSLVSIQNVNAVASSAAGESPRYAYVKAEMQFGGITVQTSAGANDAH